MSAWIVSREHIDALVQGLVESEIVVRDPSEVGRALWAECLTSVAYRYPNDGDGERPGPIGFRDDDVSTYTYTRPAQRLGLAALLKQASCYDYQTCEHPEYPDSEPYKWIKLLTEHLKRAGVREAGAEYDDAPWGL